MRKLIATEFVSLDGYMDEPGTWTFPFWNDEIAQFKDQEFDGVEVQLLGRRTYDGFSAAWPAMTDAFADRITSMTKYVASRTRTRTEFEWNSVGLTGDLVEAVTELKAQDGGNILLAGSGQVLNAVLEAGLVDELRLLVYPVVLHGEQPLFRSVPRTVLKLTSTQTFDSGVVGLVYDATPNSSTTPTTPTDGKA
jgi:dihydrofolate reductase